ncbi:MAG: RNA polymerase sigma factor region1.1 domain-containing protein, partial [Alphaproteobacteria bacterium]
MATNTEDKKSTATSSSMAKMDPMLAAALEGLKKQAKTKGFLSIDDINLMIPDDQSGPEQIEEIMTRLAEASIKIVDSDDDEDATASEADSSDDEEDEASARGNLSDDDVGRTDDPVRMYLREMGSVELLSREGEIAIAKRIEAGREEMIAGVCESPLTFQALMSWRDLIKEEKILLRDIIDLDSTYAASGIVAPPVVPAASTAIATTAAAPATETIAISQLQEI